jgi:exosortase/archaeosortase family protein
MPEASRSSCTRSGSAFGRTALRAILVLIAVPLVYVVASPWWITLETVTVGRLLGWIGVDARRTGHELLLRNGGDPVVLIVVGWCSACAVVLALIGMAWVLPGSPRMRRRSLGWALAIVVVGNLLRLTAIGWVAATWAPSQVDAFHDGPATAFAVVAVLLAVAVVALGAPWRRHTTCR